MSATPGRIAAAVLLPPFGVYLKRGGGRDFWIGTALTMLAFVPGVAFALWSVLSDPPGRGEGDRPPAGGGEARRAMA